MAVGGDGATSEGLALQEMMHSTCRRVDAAQVKDAAAAAGKEMLMVGRTEVRRRGKNKTPSRLPFAD